MEIVAYEMKYFQSFVPENVIDCIPFHEAFFRKYMSIYNACFYNMRKSLDIHPYNYLHSYEQIREKTGDIFLLLDDGEIIGSVACYGNEIDDLIVNEKYQGRGYGKQLLLWGMNHIRQRSAAPISLHVAKWNDKALRLYRELGFELTKIEQV